MNIRMIVGKAKHITDDHMSTRNGRIPLSVRRVWMVYGTEG
jgi:hypothetical protein